MVPRGSAPHRPPPLQTIDAATGYRSVRWRWIWRRHPTRAELDNHWKRPTHRARPRRPRTECSIPSRSHSVSVGARRRQGPPPLPDSEVARRSSAAAAPDARVVDQCLEVGGLGIVDGIEQRKPRQLDSAAYASSCRASCSARRRDLAQLARSLMQQWPNSHAHGFAPPTWESRSWVSASWSALITASRSPFST